MKLLSPSDLLHLAVAAAVLYLFWADPLGSAPFAVLTFGASIIVVKSIKFGVRAVARFCGIDGKDAFWRRPAAAGRGPESPGFPSAHTSHVGTLFASLALRGGLGHIAALAASTLPTIAMAAARVGDEKHTVLQTVAGGMLGPPLGLAIHDCIAFFLLEDNTLPSWVAGVAFAGGVIHFLRDLGPKLLKAIRPLPM
eukprot:TRINITY_DN79548_c0_g1_i1.p1 TRINITY_DN79548_c0_g1~~TRINITY_DN79548_c0_g1_i1.p1  ORF type:complete len:196 (-),score=31.96 TRINITY_DN79548_c0_g1_i1:144-731(-)